MKTITYLTTIAFLILSFSALSGQPSGTGGSAQTLGLSGESGTGNPGDLSKPLPYRPVFWVHGLGGDPQISWQVAGAETENKYMIESLYPGYTQTGLNGAGKNLRVYINHHTEGKNFVKAPFAIGHSQGGLAMRAAAFEAIKTFGEDFPVKGIVTFGTPHNGAPIIDNIPEIIQLLEEGCLELIDGPLTELLETNFLLDLITNSKDVRNKLGPLACGLVATGISSEFASFQSRSGKDFSYQNPSEYFQNLKKETFPDIQKVAFGGKETEPVLLRQMAWMSKSPESVDPWQANPDDEYVNSFNDLILKYKAKADANSSSANSWRNKRWLCLTHPICHLFVNSKIRGFEQTSSSYKRGYSWLNSLNEKWKVLIGASEYRDQQNFEVCKCAYFIHGDYRSWSVVSNCEDELSCRNKSQHSNDGSWSYECDCTQEIASAGFYQIDDSDGVIPFRTSIAFPGVHHFSQMLGSNHQQMRNDKNADEKINELMAGRYGDLFITKKRK